MRLKINLDQIKEAVEGISENFRKKNYLPAFKQAQKELISMMVDCFQEGKDPSGEQWKSTEGTPYTEATVKYKNRMQIKIVSPLIMTGELERRIESVNPKDWTVHNYMMAWHPNTVGDSTFARQVKYQNDGNPRNLMFKSLAPIPPRRFIPNQEEFNKIVENTFQNVLKELAR